MQITPEITIRNIQHFLYCAHRWGLLEIGNSWAENFFVTKANLMHKHVDDKHNIYTKRGKKVFSSVPVYCDLYGLYGVVDCIEGTKAENGVYISNEKYKLSIVEYKPTQPKYKLFRHEDFMQVFAQKICVDYIFNCDCDAFFYYADTKNRIEIPFKENYSVYENELKTILAQMRHYINKGIIPPKSSKQYCAGCSMKDICMPSFKSLPSIKAQIEKLGM